MKKIILLGAACAALFASCVKERTLPEPKAAASGELRFEIRTLSNTLRTRGDLLSQTPVNTVENVEVYVFDADGDYQITIPVSWNKGDTSGFYSVQSVNYQLTTTGDYTFVGVGADASHEFTIPATPTTLDAFTASVASAGQISELYAGQNTVTITAGEGAVVPLELSRKVAGILGYFTNVPAEINGKPVTSIQLRANAGNSSVYLGDLATMGTPFAAAPYTLLEIDLTGQTAVDGIYPGNFAETGLTSELPNPTQLANSQLKGVYAFPAKGVTLTLALCGAGDTALKQWTIKDAETGETTFDLAANNLFSIGKKSNVSSTYGDGNTPGGGDDDEGVDLLNDREITIDILTDWSAINYLNLGPEVTNP